MGMWSPDTVGLLLRNNSALRPCRSFHWRGLTETQRRQLMLADNRIALNAGWDLEMLKLELKDLSEIGADLSALGFAKHELAAALASEVSSGLTDEDEAPELADAAVSRLGDCLVHGATPARLWGQHGREGGQGLVGLNESASDGDRPAVRRGI
jgi:hypothetical protein